MPRFIFVIEGGSNCQCLFPRPALHPDGIDVIRVHEGHLSSLDLHTIILRASGWQPPPSTSSLNTRLTHRHLRMYREAMHHVKTLQPEFLFSPFLFFLVVSVPVSPIICRRADQSPWFSFHRGMPTPLLTPTKAVIEARTVTRTSRGQDRGD